MELDAAEFAAAWGAVWLATGKDKHFPILQRTVGIDWYDDRGLRLAATDRSTMAVAWVGVDGEPPAGLDEAPDEQLVVSDPDGRVALVADYAGQRALGRQLEIDPDVFGQLPVDTGLMVEVSRAKVRRPQLQLYGTESPDDFVVDFNREERVAATVIEGDFPTYQPQVNQRLDQVEATAGVALPGPALAFMVALGNLSKKLTRDPGMCLLDFDGDMGAVLVRHSLLEGVTGLVQPKERDAAAVVPDMDEPAA